jgi:hypothetical protein
VEIVSYELRNWTAHGKVEAGQNLPEHPENYSFLVIYSEFEFGISKKVITPFLRFCSKFMVLQTTQNSSSHGSRDENITSRVPRAFWFSNKAG